jgi:2-dehydro-3-deoxyphosphooctonate aldolase (KDO 8-P synthase)
MRGIPKMKYLNFPVILDITHSLQQPNQSTGVTGGQPEMIETIGRAGMAAGADGIFIETHPKPENALSDGANMLNIKFLKNLLHNLLEINKLVAKLDKNQENM